MNQQFVSVTDARANLKQLMDLVVAGKTRVVLVRESKPEVALVRYGDVMQSEEAETKEWQMRFDRLLKDGKKAGRKWAKTNDIDLKNASEEELYDLINNMISNSLRRIFLQKKWGTRGNEADEKAATACGGK